LLKVVFILLLGDYLLYNIDVKGDLLLISISI